jgi:phage shock protein A
MLLKRLKVIFEGKANKALEAMEDPRETLDLSYEKQLNLLRDVKRGIVDVAAAKRRLQAQADAQRKQADTLEQQARQAIAAGREDLARSVLESRQVAMTQLEGLDAQVAQLEREQQQLINTEKQLTSRIEAFRTRKEVMKAQYTAAQATVRVGEAVSGISEEMADLGIAMQRAEDRTAQMQARSAAIGDLMEAGVLNDPLDSRSSVEREIAEVSRTGAVELELDRIRRELAPPAEPKLLESGDRT